MKYRLAEGYGNPLPPLVGTLALANAKKEDICVLIYLAQCEEITETEIATELAITAQRVNEALEYWRKCRILVASENSVEEIPEVLRDKIGLGDTVAMIAEIIKKPDANFSQSELDLLKTMLADERFDSEYIVAIVKYCYDLKKGSFNLSYIEKPAAALYESGLHTASEVYEYTEARGKLVYEVKRLFGFGSTSLSDAQKKYVDKWAKNGVDKIIFTMAYDIMADTAQRRTFSYVDSILTDWINNGCKTPAEVNALLEKRKSENLPIKKAGKRTVGARNAIKPNFDVKEAAANALKRSMEMLYRETDEENKNNGE